MALDHFELPEGDRHRIEAAKAVVTDLCRDHNGNLTSLNMARQEINKAAEAFFRDWPVGQGARLELVATVTYPKGEGIQTLL